MKKLQYLLICLILPFIYTSSDGRNKVNSFHGTILKTQYYSRVMHVNRPMNVYLPYSYNESPNRKYPVLYLQHGGGEDENGWLDLGKVDSVLDSFIAIGKAKEMIVVMINGHISLPGKKLEYNKKGMEPFQNEMIQNVIPFVEGKFRTKCDAKNRALAGLSMGGGQTFYTGLLNTDKFSYIGIFGTGLFGGIESEKPFNMEEEIPGLISNSKKFNKALSLFYVSVGIDDPRYKPTEEAVGYMRKNGLSIIFNSFPGKHEWKVWCSSLHDFLPYLFKGKSKVNRLNK